MRLPGIGPTQGMQSKARKDVSSPLAEVNARNAAFAAIGGTSAAFLIEYENKETRRQIQENDLKVHDDMTAFQKKYGAKKEFNIMDQDSLDDPLMTEALSRIGAENVDSIIPSYRMMPELRAAAMQASIEQHGGEIMSVPAREKWINDLEETGRREYYKGVVNAQQQQQIHMDMESMSQIERYMEPDEDGKSDYDGALLALEHAEFDTKTTDKVRGEIMSQKQSDYFNETLEIRNVELMKIARKELNDNDPATTDNLTKEKQRIFSNMLRTAIGQETQQVDDGVRTQLKLDKDDARSMIGTWESGGDVNAKDQIRIYDSIKSDRKNDPVLVRDFERAANFQPHLTDIMTSSPQLQKAMLADWKRRSNGTTDDQYMIDHLEKSIATGDAMRQKDTMEYGARWEGMQIAPLNFGSTATLKDSLEQRKSMATTLQDKYGSFTGYLRASEVSEFGDRVKNSNTEEKLELFGQINAGLGDQAGAFYEQMKREGIESSAMIAGQIVAEEGPKSLRAKAVLQGAAIRKEDPTWVAEAKKDIMGEMAREYGTLFGGNVIQRKAVEEATLDAYAYLAESSGTKDMFDADLYKAASGMATGGIVNLGNSTVVSPGPNVDTKAFKKFFKDVKPEVLGGALNYSGEQLKTALNNEDLNLVGKGKGKYYLQDNQGNYVYIAPNIPYVLNYSDNPENVNESKSLWQKIKDQADWAKRQTYDIPRSGHWNFEKGGL